MENKMDEIKSTLMNTLREILYPLVAIIVSFVAGAILVYAFGNSPVVAYKALIIGALGDLSKLGETLVTTTTLILTGLSVAFAYKCGLFNIGAEGQYIMGSVAAVWVGWAFQGLSAIIHVTLTLLAGALAGGIWAGIVGWLKAKVGSHEVINCIMMNYVALNLSNYLIMTALNEPGKAFSYEIAPTAKLWRFAQSFEQFKYSRLHIGIIIAIIVAIGAYYLLNKTIAGYEIRAVGFNPSASEYGGINVNQNIVLAMIISGMFSGLAGGMFTSGVQYRVNNLFGFTGYGFDGISVALVGNNNPIGVIISGLLFGILQKGGPMMQIEGIPKEVVGIIQGIILLFVASNFVRVIVQQYKENKEIKKQSMKGEVK